MSPLKTFLGLLLILSGMYSSEAQDDANIVGKVVTVEDRTQVISDVSIRVKKDGKSFLSFKTDQNGKFNFNLDLDFKYEIYFSKKGYVTKWVIIDTKGIPEEDKEGGFKMKIDMSLFKKRKNFDASILKKPIGLMHYFSEKNALDWVYSHTENIQAQIKNASLKADSLNKPKFDKLLKKGDIALEKNNTRKAKSFYQKAKLLIPENALIEEKLNSLKTKKTRNSGVKA